MPGPKEKLRRVLAQRASGFQSEESLEKATAALERQHAEAERQLTERVVSALRRRGEAPLADELVRLQATHLAIARVRRLCASPGTACREALRSLEAAGPVEGGERLPLTSAAELLKPGPPASWADPRFMKLCTATAEAALRGLRGLGFEIMAKASETSVGEVFKLRHTFYLIASGTAADVRLASSTIIDFDYVPSGAESVPNPVLVASFEASTDFSKREIYVEAFGRDVSQPSSRLARPTAEVSTAAQLLFCFSMAALGLEIDREGPGAHRYTVLLSAADRGSGRLLQFYRASFGLESRSSPHQLSADLGKVLFTCMRSERAW